MSARLLQDMEARRTGLSERGSGYKMAGERELARLAFKASYAIADAIKAMEDFDAAEGEAQNQAKEA